MATTTDHLGKLIGNTGNPPLGPSRLREAIFQSGDKVEGFLDFVFVERGVAAVGTGIEDALGGVQYFVDQFDVFHHLPVFVFEQGAEVLARTLELAAIGDVEAG